MPRRLLKRLMPDHTKVREHRHLNRWLGKRLHDPNLWHLNRYSVSSAMAVGLFAAFIPLPIQILISAVLAVVFRANLPIAVGLTFITNPLTMAPIFYVAYKLGAWLLHIQAQVIDFEVSLEWFENSLAQIWQPLLLGIVLLALSSAALGYAVVRVLWRMMVIRSWRRRKQRRMGKNTP